MIKLILTGIVGLLGWSSGIYLGKWIDQGFAVHGRAAFGIELALALVFCLLSAGGAASAMNEKGEDHHDDQG